MRCRYTMSKNSSEASNSIDDKYCVIDGAQSCDDSSDVEVFIPEGTNLNKKPVTVNDPIKSWNEDRGEKAYQPPETGNLSPFSEIKKQMLTRINEGLKNGLRFSCISVINRPNYY